MKIFSGVSGLFCDFTRYYRNDRHKTAPSPIRQNVKKLLSLLNFIATIGFTLLGSE